MMLSLQTVGEEDGIEIQPSKTPTIGKHGLTENIAGIERKAEELRHFLLAQSLEAKLAIVSDSHDYISIRYAEFACLCFDAMVMIFRVENARQSERKKKHSKT